MAKNDIFISYSRRDKSKVDEVVNHLKNLGYNVWIDIDGIESGDAFRGVIVDAIENSELVLFFSSKFSNNSKWTTKEISLAVDSDKYIIPIKLDSAKYNKNIRLDLIDLDYIDLSEIKIYDASVEKLCRTIANKIGTRKVLGSDLDASLQELEISDKTAGRVVIRNDHTDLKTTLSQYWINRNMMVNIVICMFVCLAFAGLFVKVPTYYPSSMLGLVGCCLLLTNREDGFPLVAAGCFFWTLSNAYNFPSGVKTFRFFQQSGFLISWLPLLVAGIALLLFFIKRKGLTWWKYCKKISIGGIVVLTLTTVFWLWIIYFDTVTKWGLPLNLRHYINRMWQMFN